jgi:hypothetical protein
MILRETGLSCDESSSSAAGGFIAILHFVVQRSIAGAIHREPARLHFQRFAGALPGMIQDVHRSDRTSAD